MRSLVSVIVLFPKQEIARNIRNLLVRSGFEVIGVCVTAAQVIQRMEGMEEGIVVCGYKYADMVYTELREYLSDGIQMVLIASRAHLEEECDGENIHYLSMPLKAHSLVETMREIVSRISHNSSKKKHRPKPRTREELELLDGVKRLLMENNRISEEEAHRYIQKRSMDSGVSLIEMAKMIKESLTY